VLESLEEELNAFGRRWRECVVYGGGCRGFPHSGVDWEQRDSMGTELDCVCLRLKGMFAKIRGMNSISAFGKA
jgi:hypothetical protein